MSHSGSIVHAFVVLFLGVGVLAPQVAAADIPNPSFVDSRNTPSIREDRVEVIMLGEYDSFTLDITTKPVIEEYTEHKLVPNHPPPNQLLYKGALHSNIWSGSGVQETQRDFQTWSAYMDSLELQPGVVAYYQYQFYWTRKPPGGPNTSGGYETLQYPAFSYEAP